MDKRKNTEILIKILEFLLMLMQGFFISGTILMLNEKFLHIVLEQDLSWLNTLKMFILALWTGFASKYWVEK